MFRVDSVEDIVNTLLVGGIIVYPTDTIWGIGCDATNEIAVERIYKLKERPRSKPLIILANSVKMIKKYSNGIHPRIETLLALHKKPLTIIYSGAKDLAPILLGPEGSIGIRLTRDPFCKALISKLGRPVVATSANLSGEPFPQNYGEISSNVLRGVDYIVRHRQAEKESLPPSVIARQGKKGELIFLRE